MSRKKQAYYRISIFVHSGFSNKKLENRYICIAGIILSLVLPPLVLCAVEPPAWWHDPIKEDAGYLYLPASGTSTVSYDCALQSAQQNALKQILASIGVIDNFNFLQHHIKGWKIHARFDQRHGRDYFIWIILKYPKFELDELVSYVQGASDQFEQINRLYMDKRYDEVITRAERLIAEYPIGQQPLFHSEKALLIASDCCRVTGRPNTALAYSRKVIDMSTDTSYKNEARRRLNAIQSNYTNIVLRSIFKGKTFIIHCFTELDGEFELWLKMQKEIESLVRQNEGQIHTSYITTNSLDFIEHLQSRIDTSADITEGSRTERVIVFSARGHINTRKNENNKTGSLDYQFDGTTAGVISTPTGRELYEWERTGMTGWNPISKRMCMEVLALNVLEAWRGSVVHQTERRD
ncbi:MAG: hypothetical protein EOM12_04255 [Verrucomicrobiae bacterium]|nr:hypothetical protein [Verrucomicrobiae bacterium]